MFCLCCPAGLDRRAVLVGLVWMERRRDAFYRFHLFAQATNVLGIVRTNFRGKTTCSYICISKIYENSLRKINKEDVFTPNIY